MTAKELYDKHGPGVWWALKHSAEEKAFRPLGLSEVADIIVGETKKIAHSLTSYVAVGNENYILYQEKPKPMIRWQWAHQTNLTGEWTSNGFFFSEQEAKNNYGTNYKKLEYTRTEFEE